MHFMNWTYLSIIICIQLYGFKYSYLILIIFKQTYLMGILAATNTLNQSGHGSNSNWKEYHTARSSRNGTSQSNVV